MAVARARLVTQHPHLMANYARAEINIVRGEGVLISSTSRGTATSTSSPGSRSARSGTRTRAIARAIADQAATLVHCSNLYHHEPAGTLADRLARTLRLRRASSSAIPAPRRTKPRSSSRASSRAATANRERTTILACHGSFHGRTLGALAATDNPRTKKASSRCRAASPSRRSTTSPRWSGRSTTRSRRSSSSRCKARAASIPRDRAFLEAARDLCDERGALLIFDEVQCGMGRLGTTVRVRSSSA